MSAAAPPKTTGKGKGGRSSFEMLAGALDKEATAREKHQQLMEEEQREALVRLDVDRERITRELGLEREKVVLQRELEKEKLEVEKVRLEQEAEKLKFHMQLFEFMKAGGQIPTNLFN